MNNIVRVTDLFDNLTNVNNNTKFILITTDNIKPFIVELDATKTNGIDIVYGYNINSIQNVLNKNNLDIGNFRFLYHIYHNKNMSYPKHIIMANRSVSKFPKDYVIVDKFNNGILWNPVVIDGYNSIGLFYTKNVKPLDENYGIVENNYLIRVNEIINNIGTLNEYHSITHPTIEKYTILRAKTYTGAKNFKLMDFDGKYISLSADSNTLELKTGEYDEKQTMSYNAMGELIMNDKCLTAENNDNVSLRNCSPRPDKFETDSPSNQKWFPYGNTIRSANNKCLASNSKSVHLSDCDNTDSQEFTMTNTTDRNSDDYEWNKRKGRTVVLVDNENPWYINKDITESITPIQPDDELEFDKYKYKNADFSSSRVLNFSKEDLGYGHSYASRQGKECTEGFGTYYNYTNIIIIILLVLIFIYVIARKFLM